MEGAERLAADVHRPGRREVAGGDDREDLRRAPQDGAVARGRHRAALRDPGRREPGRAGRGPHHPRVHHRETEGLHPPDPRPPLRHGLHRLLRLVLGGGRARAAQRGVPAAPEDERGQLPGPPGRAPGDGVVQEGDPLASRTSRDSGIASTRSGAEVYNKLGIATVVLAGGEIVPALERGAIDGAEWINCYDDKILGIDKVAKFHYAPGMHEPTTVGEFIINKAKWDALPPDLKEIVKTSVQASYWNHFVRFQEKTAKACQELLASGVKIIKTTDELNKAFLESVRRGLAGRRGQGRVLPEGDRLAEEVLRAAGALPPLVLAELQLHRRALLQGQDLAEVEGWGGRTPGGGAEDRPVARAITGSSRRTAGSLLLGLGAPLPRTERRNRVATAAPVAQNHQDVAPAVRATIKLIDTDRRLVGQGRGLAHRAR